jgi:hypothetical protein
MWTSATSWARPRRFTTPAGFPVEQPMRFDFAVNLKTARELAIAFPNKIMLEVTEAIHK